MSDPHVRIGGTPGFVGPSIARVHAGDAVVHAGSLSEGRIVRVQVGGCTGTCVVDTWTRTAGPLDWGTSDAGLAWGIWTDSDQDSWIAEVDGSVGILGLECDQLVQGGWVTTPPPPHYEQAYYSEVRAYLYDSTREDYYLPSYINDTLEFWFDVTLSNIPTGTEDYPILEWRLAGDESGFLVGLWPNSDDTQIMFGNYDSWDPGGVYAYGLGLDYTKVIHVHGLKEPYAGREKLSVNIWQGTEPEGWLISDSSASGSGADTLSVFEVRIVQSFHVGNSTTTMQARFDCLVITQACP